MSVFKPKSSDIYVYDFQWRGHRFSRSTGSKSKREAEQVERDVREKLAREAAAGKRKANQPMTLDDACGRYWQEVGQHVRNPGQVEWAINYLLKHLGEETPLQNITDNEVATLVARRRGEFVDNVMARKHAGKRKLSNVTSKAPRRVSPATINRSVTEPLRRILLRARDVWSEDVGAVVWKLHKQKEPKERIRSLSSEEEERLFLFLPSDYEPIVRFAMRTGCRAMECINLRWSDIDWGNRRISILGKGNKLAFIPLPIDVRNLLFPLRASDGEFVFMKAAAPRKTNILQPRVRITYRAYYSALRRATHRSGISALRIHDLRHTAATRLVSKTGNLKMAMKLLRHEDISTTAKYAAVLDDDLRQAMDAMAQDEVPMKVPGQAAKCLTSNT